MDLHGNKVYIDYLQTSVNFINGQINRGIGLHPKDVETGDVDEYDNKLQKYDTGEERYNEINPGDKVRIALDPGAFTKGYRARFSTQVYTIVKKDGFRFIVADSDGKELSYRYSINDLQFVNNITKVIQ
ncbi:hypothetical protein SeLEV6574_g00084 [Synchytrium endobioticum]|uniref:Uncharacterized protein n=1 Tax=Synchytrium endobioticum TaxID=286115 RepID=A0A507DLV3_9FUNG|nr:hypothetical protein SeLEV6574_g00084 [Synchytrium endobioticum]